jgi:hypothetical protein
VLVWREKGKEKRLLTLFKKEKEKEKGKGKEEKEKEREEKEEKGKGKEALMFGKMRSQRRTERPQERAC